MPRLEGLSHVDTSDGDLVRRVLAGEVEAYRHLVARYRVRFGRYATHMIGNPQDAEEALQDALVRAYRSLPRCENPDRFGAWFFRILANRCRTRRRRRIRTDRIEGTDLPPDVPGPAPDQAESFAWREAIGDALDHVPVAQRQAFLLRHVEGMSYEEMAELTGAGVSALKMRVMRACERLRELLSGEMS